MVRHASLLSFLLSFHTLQCNPVGPLSTLLCRIPEQIEHLDIAEVEAFPNGSCSGPLEHVVYDSAAPINDILAFMRNYLNNFNQSSTCEFVARIRQNGCTIPREGTSAN